MHVEDCQAPVLDIREKHKEDMKKGCALAELDLLRDNLPRTTVVLSHATKAPSSFVNR